MLLKLKQKTEINKQRTSEDFSDIEENKIKYNKYQKLKLKCEEIHVKTQNDSQFNKC